MKTETKHKKIQKQSKEILSKLEDKKKYRVEWSEIVTYEALVEAKDEEEAQEEARGNGKEIDIDFVEGSLNIKETHWDKNGY